ncbi:glycosyltransferase, partial [Candidatus Woesebacteria bacterium]|nr:glycosyltransferase [Candidatus Woesebacteria bacterium]
KDDADTLPPLSGPYVVTIAGGEWRKNLRGTLQFFALKFPKNWRLVVICKLGRREKVAFQLLAISYGLWGHIVWAGEVSDSTKWQYLKSARVLLSLSYGEGLNLPLLEAKAVGVPSMTLDTVRAVYDRPIGKLLFSDS